jgi:hypothetical protein
LLVAALALLVGCQRAAYRDNSMLSSPIFDDSQPRPTRDRIATSLSYPDRTMFFLIIDDVPPRADLNLRAIGCELGRDGGLVVTARVENQGADVVPAIELLTGDRGAFRVAAIVTTASGTRERVDTVFLVPLTVPAGVDLRLAPTQAPASQVTRIDVIADPDYIVPDPFRENNTLSWQGTMPADSAGCSVVR